MLFRLLKNKFTAHLSSSSVASLLTSGNVFLPVDHLFLKGCWSLVVNLYWLYDFCRFERFWPCFTSDFRNIALQI
jgi:hypothetical protein